MSHTAGPIHRTGVDRRAPLADVVISRNGAGMIAELAHGVRRRRWSPLLAGPARRHGGRSRGAGTGLRPDAAERPADAALAAVGQGGGALPRRRSRSAPLTSLRLPPR
jgi:hypothetical protein